MVSAGDGRVKAALVVLVLAGCFWRTYGRLAATHVEVLTAMARKGADLVASGRLTAESMPELTYPLERAQAFARTARERSGEAPPATVKSARHLHDAKPGDAARSLPRPPSSKRHLRRAPIGVLLGEALPAQEAPR